MSMTKEELFKKAKEKRQKEKEKEARRDSFSYGPREDINYCPLSAERLKIVRVLGAPLQVREKPSDPKRALISLIMGDDGKKFRCIWPTKEDKPDWILWRVYHKIMEYSVKGSGKDFQKIYTHKDTHPECFRRVATNNLENKYEKGWTPTQYILMNVIDREDPEFHEEHKKAKILSKKASKPKDDGSIFYEPGVPITTYNAIWDNVAEFYGNWENYDVAIRKMTESPWYTAMHAVEEKIKIDEEYQKYIVEGPLTKEEKNYKLYDFDKMFNVTSYNKIKVRLGNFFKKVDVDFGTSFYEELVELAEKEEKENAKKHEEEKAKNNEPKSEPKENTPSPKTEEKEEPKEVKTRTRKPKAEKKEESVEIPWDKLADGSYNGKVYEGVPLMTEEEKEMVKSIKEDGSFEYYTNEDLCENVASGFISPGAFHVDPLNGDLFED